MASETERMSISINVEKQKQLDNIASMMDRSRNWLVNEAIDQYLEIYTWQAQKIEAALEKTTQPDAKYYSSDEVDEILQSFKP